MQQKGQFKECYILERGHEILLDNNKTVQVLSINAINDNKVTILVCMLCDNSIVLWYNRFAYVNFNS